MTTQLLLKRFQKFQNSSSLNQPSDSVSSTSPRVFKTVDTNGKIISFSLDTSSRLYQEKLTSEILKFNRGLIPQKSLASPLCSSVKGFEYLASFLTTLTMERGYITYISGYFEPDNTIVLTKNQALDPQKVPFTLVYQNGKIIDFYFNNSPEKNRNALQAISQQYLLT